MYDKFVDYIKYAASHTYSTFQTESAEDLFQEGQIILYKCWISYGDRSEEEMGKLIKSAIWRKLREVAGKKRLFTTDFDTLQEQGIEPGYEEDMDAHIDEDNTIQRVADMLKDYPIALTILREFVNPSERTIWEAKMDIERKTQIRGQGYIVIVPATVQPSKVAIQRALEISRFEFERNFKILKKAMACVYNREPQKMRAAM